jgi:hypothetical protein
MCRVGQAVDSAVGFDLIGDISRRGVLRGEIKEERINLHRMDFRFFFYCTSFLQ